MSFCGNTQDKERIKKRLNRIGGQVRGISKMIDDDRECMDILNQIVSISSALKGVWKQITSDHLKGHITEAILNSENSEELIDELVEHIEKL